eukprot:CAMPEP_0115871460 /NCGR_PEP_ID=MMETSP0287-20121206/22884_1 /TAXON_ID=412157 /ORGANISM="Chrysochromulina rotalis, Strain UIO044" /LENGTH=33 /DNA_ID= /DNA_START= /DNA_END= /DNA_ORIENTATION=
MTQLGAQPQEALQRLCSMCVLWKLGHLGLDPQS